MITRLFDCIEYWNMRVKGARILCAFSGGPDSTALLHALNSVREKYGITLLAFHVNHNLRGEESIRDEKFCRAFCEKYNIDFHSVSADVVGHSRENGIGLEQAARELRYTLFETYATRMGCNLIATAHTADDNAETVLFNMIRGSGIAGLCGIPPVRDNIIRPLIEATREEIMEYIRENNLDFVEDSTNEDTAFTRNLIRHEVIPEARRINPDFSHTLSRNTRLLRSQRDALSVLEGEAMSKIRLYGSGCRIDAAYLSSLSPAIAGSVVLSMGEMLGVRFSSVNVEDALSVLKDKTGRKRVTLPMQLLSNHRDGMFTVSRTLPSSPPPFTEQRIYEGGTVNLPAGGEITCRMTQPDKKIHNSVNIFNFDCSKIDNVLVLRSRKPGDRMRKNRSSGSTSVKKLMNEAKLEADLRDAYVVVACGDKVLAVEGIGINFDYAAGSEEPALKIEIKRRSFND